MTDRANVQSLQAIEAFKAAMAMFMERVEQGLMMIDGEMNRLTEWLDHDRPRFWKTQVRLANEEVARARADLHRCLMYPVGNERPACREERVALQRAEERLAYCDAKAEKLRHWRRELEKSRFEYDGRISQLAEVVEMDAPQALAVLGKIIRRLEEYQSVQSYGAAGNSLTSLAEELWPEGPEASQASKDEQPESDKEKKKPAKAAAKAKRASPREADKDNIDAEV